MIYANTNLAEKCLKNLQSQEEISPDESEDIFKRKMLDRYIDTPERLLCNAHYTVVNDFCYAEFLRYYYLAPYIKENDWQPMELSDEILENNFLDQVYLPAMPLMLSKGKLKYRKISSVLRFFTPNKNKNIELYDHHVLLLYFPFRSESEFKVGHPPSYTNKLGEPGVTEILNQNRNKIEPYSELVDNALMDSNMELRGNEEQEPVLENYEIDDVTETE